jgi:disulfide bond formation protein DsbB
MKKIYREKWIRIIAGSIVLISLILGLFVNKWWFLLNLFVGLNLIQSALTDFCPAEIFLAKLGIKREKDLK